MTAPLTAPPTLPALSPAFVLSHVSSRSPQVFEAAGYYTWLNPKYIRLEQPGELPRILKVAKPLRSRSPLADGTWVYVRGTCKLKNYAPTFKVEELSTCPLPTLAPSQPATPEYVSSLGTPQPNAAVVQDVAVCLKKNCCKRGAEALWTALAEAPSFNPVESGCLKACKQGPVIAIGKHVFSGTTALSDLQRHSVNVCRKPQD